MLGLKGSKDDWLYEYEPRSITLKPKKINEPKSKKNADFDLNLRENGLHSNLLAFPNEKGKNRKENLEKKEENSYRPSRENEDGSKAFMGSIGSWINDFFSVPQNKTTEPPRVNVRQPEEELIDSEYLKSITAIKEKFMKKLKSETSVHIAGGDKLLEFNFDKVSEAEKKRKLKPHSGSVPMVQHPKMLSVRNNQQATAKQSHAKPKKNSLVPKKSYTVINLTSLNLVKKKKKENTRRSGLGDLEELVFPTPSDLSKRLLLNINDEKCAQLYKPNHLTLQETQSNSPRKLKSYRSSTRCYTTTSNSIEFPEKSPSKTYLLMNPKSRGCHYYTTDSKSRPVSAVKKSSHDLKKKTKKVFADSFRDSSTFVKVKPLKMMVNIHSESPKNEPITSSDELVQYLMKKVKVQRPQVSKKKSLDSAPVTPTQKSKIMQSATNSLVMSVMAKKEGNSLISLRHSPRISSENKADFMAMKPNLEKIKYSDNNVKFEIKKPFVPNKYNKNSFFFQENKPKNEDDPAEKSKNTKPEYIEALKRDMKESSEKYNKRQEIKNMLMKLDIKNSIFPAKKNRPIDENRKIPKSSLNLFKCTEMKENPNPRFQKQHNLFKNSFRNAYQDSVGSKGIEKEKELNSGSSFSTEVAVINPNQHFQQENSKDIIKCDTIELDEPDNLALENKEVQILDLSLEDNIINPKIEKSKIQDRSLHFNEKHCKMKSQQFMKEETKGFFSPLADIGQGEGQSPKESKTYEVVASEIRSVKPIDTVLLNRRFSTNIMSEHSTQKVGFVALDSKYPGANGKERNEREKAHREALDKDKEDPENAEDCDEFRSIKDSVEKAKKPGPVCDDENGKQKL